MHMIKSFANIFDLIVKLQYMPYKKPSNLFQIELESIMIYNKESTKCH